MPPSAARDVPPAAELLAASTVIGCRTYDDVPRDGGEPLVCARFDAARIFDVPGVRVAEPKACRSGEVLTGVLEPWECTAFGTACAPETPIAICMVSSEGACVAYCDFGRFSRDRVRRATALPSPSIGAPRR